MKEKVISLNVYDENNEVVKTSKAKIVDIRFATVRKLMKLLDLENVDNNAELLKIVYSVWDELTHVLGQFFPDMEEDDWDNVKLSELIPAIIEIGKECFATMLTIPKSKEKN